MTSCPCCGSQVDRLVCVSLDTNTVATALGSVRVMKKGAIAVDLLAQKYPATVHRDKLGVAMWGDDYWDLEAGTLNVQVCIARKLIAPLGLKIISNWSVGYRLSPNKIEGA